MTTLFGFNVLEECDPISIECILKDNDWKSVWISSNDYWQMLDPDPPEASKLAWLQTVPECPPVVSKVLWGTEPASSVSSSTQLKIWIRPEDYILYVLKFA